MAPKPKITDLLTAWDETVVTVHMSVGKFRKMDEVYRENRDLCKRIDELQAILDAVQKEYNSLEKKTAEALRNGPNGQMETPTEMMRFLCYGILDALDSEENKIAIKDPVTALSLLAEATEWLEAHPETT